MPTVFTRLLILSILLAVAGCMFHDRSMQFDSDLVHYRALAREMPQPAQNPLATGAASSMTPPRTVRDRGVPDQWWDLPWEQAVQLALTHSPVIRDLGGALIRSPATVPTTLGPAIEASDPREGMEAALAAFDAELRTGLFYENNHRMLNNFFTMGGTRILEQDLVLQQTELSKRAATGTQMFLRGNLIYDANNAIANRFPFTYDTILETELRHPLLQGSGTDFNRIAGPRGTPGNFNGVMIARLNTDVSLIDFRLAVRDLLSNVTNAYWDLYFAYRDLHAKIEARNRSLETWRAVYGMMESGQPGGEAEREAQFREQFYRFDEEVKNALTGRLVDRTSVFNGSSGGTFRGEGGVHVAERRLRMLLGLEINDGRLIRPSSEPSLAPISYEWSSLIATSIAAREELKRQRIQVRRRELELVASRNFLLPRFDVVGRFRTRGLGQYWAANSETDPNDPADQVFGNSSLDNLFGGGFHEWMVGGELSMPVGFRQAHAAVRNAQLLLARERAVLDEQQRQIHHDLSNAVADVYRAYEILQITFNSRLAAKTQVEILRDKLQQRLPVNLDQLIDAERRYGDADARYHRALVEYAIAQKNVEFEKGTLLEYSHVVLAESQDACGASLAAFSTTSSPMPEMIDDDPLRTPIPVPPEPSPPLHQPE
jgi:outer membrane protein TolC